MTKMMEEETSPDIEDSVNHNRWLLNQDPAYDRLLNAEVQLQLGEEYVTGCRILRLTTLNSLL